MFSIIVWKTVWKFLKNLKTRTSYDSTIPFLVIYLKEMRSAPKKIPASPWLL
jgi:hypothetical protein